MQYLDDEPCDYIIFDGVGGCLKPGYKGIDIRGCRTGPSSSITGIAFDVYWYNRGPASRNPRPHNRDD
jgi:hypothetical protein